MIRIDDHGSVRVLELDRPPANALSMALLAALSSALDAAREDSSVKAVVLASSQEKIFSAGLDLAELSPEAGLGTRPFGALIAAHRTLASFPKPSVAAINGLAILGGWILALGCDARIFSEDAKATLSEVRLGLSPTEAFVRTSLSLARDPRAVRAMVLRGSPLDAQEAEAAGLADRVVALSRLREESIREAKSWARVPPGSYAAVKRDLRSAWGLDDPALWERSKAAFQIIHGGEEARTGMAAASRRSKGGNNVS